MEPRTVTRIRLRPATLARYHRRERSRARNQTPARETYRDRVPQDESVSRQRFARYVARALADARDRGMTDSAIYKATGVSPATFHRWQNADFRTAPDLGKVATFCEGLGVPVEPALRALGLEAGRDDPSPDPTLDPDIRRIARILSDPNVSNEDKALVREMIRMVADRVTVTKPRS